LLKKIAKAADQTIDIISRDTLIYAGRHRKARRPAPSSPPRSANTLSAPGGDHRAANSYSRPYKQRLTEPMLKELEKKLRDNHAAWTEDNLWNAFAAAKLARSKAARSPDALPTSSRSSGSRWNNNPCSRLRRLRDRTVQRMAHGQGQGRRQF